MTAPERSQSDEFLGDWDVKSVSKMLGSRPPTSLELDMLKAHAILDAVDVPQAETLVDRLVWIADRWLALAKAQGHSGGCQDKLCVASRKIKSSDLSWDLLYEMGMLDL